MLGTYLSPDSVSPIRQRIRASYRIDEEALLPELVDMAKTDVAKALQVQTRAKQLVQNIRRFEQGKGGLDALLTEFSLSTEEGVVLMCLAESLLRVPDRHNIDQLIRDKLALGDWASHLGKSDSLFVNASAWGLLLTGKMVQYNSITDDQQFSVLHRAVGRLGEPVIRQTVRLALRIVGTQFVLGTTIHLALQRAKKQEAKGFLYSYDMLGEGARTQKDAQCYLDHYLGAIDTIGTAAQGRGPVQSPGISVKLSALHARYEFGQRQRVMTELVARLKQLALLARDYDIGLTVDAEEADRLELSLDVIEAVFKDPELNGWQGFGLAIQAYQKRAIAVVDWANDLAVTVGRRLMVRLVKGAYWDTEIKFAQVEGFSDYPVFTSKPATDVSYLACAKRLLQYRDNLYPQFATHNACTVAAIIAFDEQRTGFEFQRLHGMGESLFIDVMAAEKIPCRIYAPVGEHADLLAYLVRRLLENGANTSFVNNIVDKNISVDTLLSDPVATVESWVNKRNTAIALPEDLFGRSRKNAAGLDLTDPVVVAATAEALDTWWTAQRSQQNVNANTIYMFNPADCSELVGTLYHTTAQEIEQKLQRAHSTFPEWNGMSVAARAERLNRLANLFEAHRDSLLGFCIKEAGKTADDAVAEVREAIDFCRYYAQQAIEQIDSNTDSGRGVVLCISPWNFPLAIFVGQICAALAAGNTVVAKAAEQTGLIAAAVIKLIDACGFPAGAVELIVAPGKRVGEQLVPDSRIQAVMFTGSTGVAKWLSRTLAARADNSIPLIAETGGQNAMIVDSTALPEQVVDDVIQSGFHSAGQRCSALRVLFLQEEIAQKITDMIVGAMEELQVGDPANLATDVGPVIDQRALTRLQEHTKTLSQNARLHHQCTLTGSCKQGYFIAPHLFEIKHLSQLTEEVFGPVVHIIRYKATELDQVIAQINQCGFGLTLGIHSRIQTVREKIASAVQVGNVYLNRNMVGAVVGVQPFGGRGLSGTGPKAGGPRYLSRLLQPGPLSVSSGFATVVSNKTENQSVFSAQELPRQELPTQKLPRYCYTPTDVFDIGIPQLLMHFNHWRALPLVLRASLVKRWITQWATSTAIKQPTSLALQLVDQAESTITDVVLPGPTGEANCLRVEARGVLVAYIDKASDITDMVVAAAAALVTGNALFFVVTPRVYSSLKANLFATMDHTIPFAIHKTSDVLDDLSSRLEVSAIAGVVLSPNSSLRRAVQGILADADGTILPLIDEPISRFYLNRFVLEKTISEDTTAAGGNASLMTLADAHETQGHLLQAV